jgi:flagellar protein FlaE/flagellar protein FlaC
MRFISLGEPLLALSSSGLIGMGIMNWIGDDDGDSATPEDASGDVSADGGDDLFGDLDDGGEEFGDVDDGFEEGFDDDFGGMGGDDFGGAGEGDQGGGGGQVHQGLENRVDGLENDVAEISSTINTVRSENEEISETVDEIEENVRKLLEIYEMVTRGVNPFVDDVQDSAAMDGSAFGGDFGLFEDDGGDDQDEEDLDEDVMDADAESFFDDEELDDLEDGDDSGGDPDEATPEDDPETEFEDANGDSGSGASSFQELKAEYESGEADWADDEGNDGGTDAADETVTTADEEFEFDEPVADPATTGGSATRSDGKPYLETVPGGYVVDLVIMEWLEFLVEEFGPEEAVRTIEYYERIEWVSESASERLLAFLEGIADVEPEEGEELGPVELDIDDHIQSLTFISQLTGDSMDRKVVDHCAQIRGEGRGIQR